MLLTAPAVWLLTTAEFSPSIVESFVDNPEDYERAEALEALFPSNPDSLVWVATTEEDLFSEETLRAIRRCAAEIQELPSVRRVLALPNLSRPAALSGGIRGTAGKILLNKKLQSGEVPEARRAASPILPFRRRASAESLAAIKEQFLSSESEMRSLLARDGRSHVMLVELAEQVMQPDDQVDLIQDLERIVRENKLGSQGYYCSGLIPLQAYGFEEIYSVLQIQLPLGIALIALAVWWVFRRVEVILVTLLIAVVSIAWGFSSGIILFGKISVLMAAVPLMVLVISTADVIHLISSYTAERNAGTEHRQAVTKTFAEVGGACVLTSITTFVGFISLIFVPANTIRQFGFSAAAGVASALILSVIIVPIFLDLLHRLGRPVTASVGASRFTQWLAMGCLRLGCLRPKFTVLVFAIALAACGYFTSQIHLDPDLTKRFWKNHDISKSTEFFALQYGGINSAELLLEAPEDVLFASETLAGIAEFRRRAQAELNCESVAAVDLLVKAFVTQLDYKNPDGNVASAVHARACVEYLRQLEPELVNSLVTENGSHMRLLVSIPQTSYLAMTQTSEKLVKLSEELFGAEIQITEKGSAPVVGRAVREIIRGHMQGFAFCFTTIFFLIAFGLRSLPSACVSVFPNLTPLLLLGGLIVLTREVADSDLLAVATLGLGLAVDDTIHFLSRFRIEQKNGKSLAQALEASMHHTGLAIIRTTLILSVGFLPFAFSTYLSLNMLGTYLIVVLAAAVLADLVLLPAILHLLFSNRQK